VIPEANAVHDPRAVVIHAQNALLADPTMVATIRLVPRAPFAVPTLTSAFGLMHLDTWLSMPKGLFIYAPLGSVWHSPGMDQDAHGITNDKQQSQYIDHHKVHFTPVQFRPLALLEHWQTMVHHVNRIDSADDDHNEEEWQDVRKLAAIRAVFAGFVDGPGVC